MTEQRRLEHAEDIDLERVVVDSHYRRRVIAFLNGLEPLNAGSAAGHGAPGPGDDAG